jgi:gluconokinase
MTSISPGEAVAPLVLTLDIGTSSARALLFDALGRTIASTPTREKYAVRATADGAAEDDPDESLARAFRCVDEVLGRAGPLASQIGAVAVATLASTFLALDSADQPLTPLITYADTRNAPDSLALRQHLDERAVHERTGCLLRTSYWPTRLAWLERTAPEIFCGAARFVALGEYLELRLFGQCRVSPSAASWTGLLDRQRLIWDAPLLEALGVAPERLSPIADVDAPLVGLLPPYAVRWPALRDVPWLPAIGDGAAANVGSGCVGPGRVALTVGTTGALRVALPAVANVPAGLWCYRVNRQHALLGGATSEGGNVVAWARRTLQLPPREETERALAALRPDGYGLTVLPLFAGERSPGWAGNAQAAINGLTLATTPLEILRAAMEGVAYRFALIAERLVNHEEQRTKDEEEPAAEPGSRTFTPSTFVASGGALLASPAWMQIVADVLGQPLIASAEEEATGRGAALLGLVTLGVIPEVDALPAALGETFKPDLEHHAVYRQAIVRQRRLYDLLIDSA